MGELELLNARTELPNINGLLRFARSNGNTD